MYSNSTGLVRRENAILLHDYVYQCVEKENEVTNIELAEEGDFITPLPIHQQPPTVSTQFFSRI